jgi:hypothetical protein
MNDCRQWRKSSYSGGHGGDCVEVASAEGGVAVRDSKDQNGPVLLVTAAQWAGFRKAVLAHHAERRALTTHCGCGASLVLGTAG